MVGGGKILGDWHTPMKSDLSYNTSYKKRLIKMFQKCRSFSSCSDTKSQVFVGGGGGMPPHN